MRIELGTTGINPCIQRQDGIFGMDKGQRGVRSAGLLDCLLARSTWLGFVPPMSHQRMQNREE